MHALYLLPVNTAQSTALAPVIREANARSFAGGKYPGSITDNPRHVCVGQSEPVERAL